MPFTSKHLERDHIVLISKLKDFADHHLRLSRAQLIVVIFLCVSIAGGSFMVYLVSKPKKLEKVELVGSESKSDERTALLKIHVAGEVKSPGLYSIEKGSRVDDAIKKAGGALPSADLDGINLAEEIEDGQKILVPIIETTTVSSGGQGGAVDIIDSADGRIHINRASANDLEELDGIGPVLAGRIVDYRDKNGSFESSDQLLKVSGIGRKKLEAIEDRIVVD